MTDVKLEISGYIDPSRDPGLSTASLGCQILSRRWVEDCIADHESCRLLADDMPFLPSRLLDLLPENKSLRVFMVVEPKKSQLPVDRYACLSHCWGGHQAHTLTKESKAELEKGTPVERLPPTFKDAIQVCLWLGIRFLWIDSLCIRQDSKSDWEREASQMGNIYRNSYLTIAATHGTSSVSGLFWPRNPLATAVPIIVEQEERTRNVAVVERTLWENEVEKSPLNGRAWVLQVSPKQIPCPVRRAPAIKRVSSLMSSRNGFSRLEFFILVRTSCIGSAPRVEHVKLFQFRFRG